MLSQKKEDIVMRRDEELDALISTFSVDIPDADPQRKEDNIALAKKITRHTKEMQRRCDRADLYTCICC